MKRLTLLALVAAAACGGKQQPANDEVMMKDAAVRDIERERIEQQRASPPVVEAEEEEELAVEMFELRQGESAVATDGLRVTLTSGGPSWAFEFDHHGRKSAVKQTGSPMYIEGTAYGTLYVIRGGEESATITLRSDTASPLTAAAALALAKRERGARLECEGTNEKTEVRENGTVALIVSNDAGEQTCEVLVGRFTGEAVTP